MTGTGEGAGPREGVVSVPAVFIDRDGNRKTALSSIVREMPFTLYLNGSEVITLICTGMHLESLAVGFLRSEGLIRDRELFRGIEINEAERSARVTTLESPEIAKSLMGKRTVTSGCGKGSTFYNSLDALQSRKIERPATVTESAVRTLISDLNSHSELYRETRGVHNSALADAGGIIIFRADIGRHNAVDMLIGECFLENIPTEDKVLLTTGRITSEILIKAAKVGIPAVISMSSATSLAVELAEKLNLTVIGRARAGAMVVYSGAENVLPG